MCREVDDLREIYKDIMNLRNRVFAEVARIAYADAPFEELESAAFRLFPNAQGIERDNVFRQRAIAEEMIRLTMGLEIREFDENVPITDGFDKVDMDVNVFELPIVDVIKFACEGCPERQHYVTDICQKCMARPCYNTCPRDAISFIKDRAVIDKEKCINCGQCRRVCPYNAIVEYNRPCVSVCGVNAIENDENGLAEINHDKCVACGRCVTQCPWGAIGDKGQIYQLVKALKSKSKKIYAAVAPSYVGQYGEDVTSGQMRKALQELGFEDMYEVGIGADMTTLHEAKEYLSDVPDKVPFMGTSCCFSWSALVELYFPEYLHMISDTGSPMRYTAEYIKDKDPEAIVCFIGPCTSKKAEAIKTGVKEFVDFVITFEELLGIFTAKGIVPAEMVADEVDEDSSRSARGYAQAGGVAAAVKEIAEKLDPTREIKIEGANSLEECVKLLKLAKAGKKNGYLLEGMACPEGCINGMGTIVSLPKVRRALKNHMSSAEFETPFENEVIAEELK